MFDLEIVSIALRNDSCSNLMVRFDFFLRKALILDQHSSIGERSGEYGGNNLYLISNLSRRFRLAKCDERLSNTKILLVLAKDGANICLM